MNEKSQFGIRNRNGKRTWTVLYQKSLNTFFFSLYIIAVLYPVRLSLYQSKNKLKLRNNIKVLKDKESDM